MRKLTNINMLCFCDSRNRACGTLPHHGLALKVGYAHIHIVRLHISESFFPNRELLASISTAGTPLVVLSCCTLSPNKNMRKNACVFNWFPTKNNIPNEISGINSRFSFGLSLKSSLPPKKKEREALQVAYLRVVQESYM